MLGCLSAGCYGIRCSTGDTKTRRQYIMEQGHRQTLRHAQLAVACLVDRFIVLIHSYRTVAAEINIKKRLLLLPPEILLLS